MRLIGALALLALATPGWAGDIYRWTDDSGNVHYSNMDAQGSDATAVAPAGPSAAARDESAPRGAHAKREAEDAGDTDAYSADASLRRNALERELRATERRLREVDGQIATLARARGERVQGSVSTGGVGVPAVAPGGIDLRSEEERNLATEREKLTQHATQIRNDAAQLRQEVTARFGATPPWWIDLR